MGAVTYPKPEVVSFVSQNLVPVQVPHDAKPLASDFNVTWTPTIIVLDPEGQEHHRTVGFVPPEDFIASLLLGAAKWHFDAGKYQEALVDLDEVLESYPSSDFAPEALYLRGVSRFETTHQAKSLKEAYEELHTRYPKSAWAKRAEPYRLL